MDYKLCIYGVHVVCTVFYGREITKYTVIYGEYVWFWPALDVFIT
jgi:hypothetical protein